MSFEQFSFDRRIADQIKAVGYQTPTPIQQQAIPEVLAGRDVMGLAQTGTGKTAAFMLPILQRLTRGPLRQVRALVLAPTRELAEQIYQLTRDFAKQTKIRSVVVYGGVSKPKQVAAIKNGAELVIACPGRLLDIMGDRDIDLSKVEVLVLDEADRMCDMGFLPDIRRILKALPSQRQTLFFSATMPDDIRDLSNEILTDPVTVQIGQIAPAKTVSHALYPVPTKAVKKDLLWAILEQKATGRVLIFTRTKYAARNLARDLDRRRYRAVALQGNMSQNQRQRAMDGFRDGKFDIMVATDIAARGIDVSDISHVINYDIPDTVDAYTHRIGRTGRAKQSGEAFTFAIPDDESLVRDIERQLDLQIERRRLDEFDYGGFDPEVQFAPQSRNGARSANNNRPSNNHKSSHSGKPADQGKRRRRRRNGRSNTARRPQQQR